MSQGRVERVAEEIKKHVGEILQEELRDPRIGFATITKVELTRDLQQAKVYFSIFGSEKQQRDTQVGLKRSAGYIRKLLGQRMKIRYTPELIFRLDEGAKHSIHISEILEKIKKDESNEGKTGN